MSLNAVCELSAWKDAVENELIVCHILNASHKDPRKAISDIIQWNVDVALDPAVSSVAAAWVDEIAALKEENARLLAANRDCMDHFNALKKDYDSLLDLA